MLVDIVFPGDIVSRVSYEFVHNIAVPDRVELLGHDNGIIVFGTGMPLDEKTARLIIRTIHRLHVASENYLVVYVRDRDRREEYIPDVLVLIHRGQRHDEDHGLEYIPVIANAPDLVRALFEANRRDLGQAVGQVVAEMEYRVDLYDVDFRNEDEDG